MTTPPTRQLLTGARIFTGDSVLEDHGLLLDGGRVAALLPEHALPTDLATDGATDVATTRLPPESWLAPGFIDAQVNGGGGVLFNSDPTVAGLRTLVAAHRRFGTTALLPTVITDAPAAMRAAVDAAAALAGEPDSGVLGIHLEGPFLNPERRGVHAAAHIRQPSREDIAYLASLPARFPHGRVLLTLAPELVDDADIRALADAGVILAAGHSAATMARTVQALDQGMRGFTHLFNAMPPLLNREPGVAGAALDDPRGWCGIIADGVHVHPAMLRLAHAAKTRPQDGAIGGGMAGAEVGGLFLVTDAMPPTGTDATSFTLYGQTIHRRDGRLVTADGVLAGADIDMAAAVRGARDLLRLDAPSALALAGLAPARFLRLDGRAEGWGRLIVGGRADIVALDRDLRPLHCWVGGVRVAVTG